MEKRRGTACIWFSTTRYQNPVPQIILHDYGSNDLQCIFLIRISLGLQNHVIHVMYTLLREPVGI